MPNPKPAGPAPRRLRPTTTLLMALVALGAGLLGVLKHVADTREERRREDLGVEAQLARSTAEVPRIQREWAARKAAERRQMERTASEFHASMARSWDRLAQRARKADAS